MSGFYLECTYISWCASILDLSLVRESSVGGGGGRKDGGYLGGGSWNLPAHNLWTAELDHKLATFRP